MIILDTETTGTDARRDQVIELCIQHGLVGTAIVWRFKPSIPVPAAATAIHGITDADLANCRSFAAYADDIAAHLAAATVLVGYNLNFDLGMLSAEFARLGRTLDLAGKHLIDPLQLWRRREPRDLQHAHQRFVGSEFDGAHGAAADVAATGRVLRGMLEEFGLDGDWAAVADECNPERATWVGPTGHLRWDADRIVVAFGKHSGTPLDAMDPGYLRWICNQDFPPHVVEVCRHALAGDYGWVRQTYGKRAA